MVINARYMPSPYHKSAPSAAGRPIPRHDKTLCDEKAVAAAGGARALLESGFRYGMVSARTRGEWPQNVWAVDAHGTVYEAQLTNRGNGEYHGYPMKADDWFTGYVFEQWEERRT